MPYEQFTIAHAKEVFENKKTMMIYSKVSQVSWPNYSEISVTKLWPEFKKRPLVMEYMPSKINKGRQIDKKYFFDILNTIYPEEM